MPPAVVMEPERKKRRRPRCTRDEAVAVKLVRWSEQNSQLPENDRKCSSRMQAKGSTKGCMKGKGGPENANCRSRGVRQRKWGKWVAEIRLPSGRGRMWLGTFATEAEAAAAYDNAAATMYGPCARLNAPQGEGNGDPATSPTLPGDHDDPTPYLSALPPEDRGDPTPYLSALPPEDHGDPTFCFTLPEENGYPAYCSTPSEEHGVSTSCLTQAEGHCDPACLSASKVYGDPTACLTLPGLHCGLTAYHTDDAAHIGPPDQFYGYQACLGLPDFYVDPAYQNAYPTNLSGPEVCDDPHLILPELHDDPTYFSMEELCGGPACVELLEDDGGSISVTAPQGGSGDHAHVAPTTRSSSFITSSNEDGGGPSTGGRMEHP